MTRRPIPFNFEGWITFTNQLCVRLPEARDILRAAVFGWSNAEFAFSRDLPRQETPAPGYLRDTMAAMAGDDNAVPQEMTIESVHRAVLAHLFYNLDLNQHWDAMNYFVDLLSILRPLTANEQKIVFFDALVALRNECAERMTKREFDKAANAVLGLEAGDPTPKGAYMKTIERSLKRRRTLCGRLDERLDGKPGKRSPAPSRDSEVSLPKALVMALKRRWV